MNEKTSLQQADLQELVCEAEILSEELVGVSLVPEMFACSSYPLVSARVQMFLALGWPQR